MLLLVLVGFDVLALCLTKAYVCLLLAPDVEVKVEIVGEEDYVKSLLISIELLPMPLVVEPS